MITVGQCDIGEIGMTGHDGRVTEKAEVQILVVKVVERGATKLSFVQTSLGTLLHRDASEGVVVKDLPAEWPEHARAKVKEIIHRTVIFKNVI